MNPQSIRIFLAIAEHKSISDAARSLYFSQSAVSQSLSQLEKELGIQLVVRSRGTRSIKLTPAGEAFIPLAKRRQELDTQFQLFVQSQDRKMLRLAANSTAHQYLIPQLTRRLVLQSPELELRLHVCLNRGIPDAVENGFFDAAFCTGPISPSSSFDAIPFFSTGLWLLCPADTVYPDRAISPEELDPHFEITSTTFLRKPELQQLRRQYFPSSAKPLIIASTVLSIENYLTDPRSWALLSGNMAMHFVSRNPSLTARPVDFPSYRHPCSILVSKSYLNSEVIEDLLQCCGSYLEDKPYLTCLLP